MWILLKSGKQKRINFYLLVDQITFHRENEQKPFGSPNGESEEIAAGDPLKGGDLTAGGRERGSDLDRAGQRRGGVPAEDEDEGSSGVGEGERLGVEGGDERGIGEPSFSLAGADVGEIVAGDGSDLGEVRSPRHLLGLGFEDLIDPRE